MKKDLKITEEKLASLERQIKSKTNELLNEISKNKELDVSLTESDLKVTKLKEDIIHEQNRTAKQVQIV